MEKVMPRERLKTFTTAQRKDLHGALTGIIEDLGSQQKLADVLGVSQTQVSYLINGINRLSTTNAAKIEKIFGIKKSILRPDIYE